MEIGSYLELDIKDTGEYYSGETNIARLNAARSGIYHACRLYNCNLVYIPFYLCPTVKHFLIKKGISVQSYFISDKFEPLNLIQQSDSAVVLVNYFGLFSPTFLGKLKSQYKNVIIDNCASFYSNPLKKCYNVYSPRKFFGVPDGCYVIGENAERLTSEYEKDYSSDTSLFLLKRIEVGSSASYADRMKNEERIDKSDILQMSRLTMHLLRGIDYFRIMERRKENFDFAHSLYKSINLLNVSHYIDSESVPMVYPLVVEDSNLVDKLKEKQIYTGRWWKNVLTEVPADSFEAWLSKYLIPIPIDQRYGSNEILHCYETLMDL